MLLSLRYLVCLPLQILILVFVHFSWRICPKILKSVESSIRSLEDVNYDITIIHDHPESILLTLSADYLSSAFFDHSILDVISNRRYSWSRICITYYEII